MKGGAYIEDPETGALKRVDEQPAAPADNQAPAKPAAKQRPPAKAAAAAREGVTP